jgi:putative transcriptional regulator
MPADTLEPRPPSGERVAAARKRAGLSQQGLAEKISAGRQSIIRIETGRQMPSVDMALAIAQAVGESVETLFGGDE